MNWLKILFLKKNKIRLIISKYYIHQSFNSLRIYPADYRIHLLSLESRTTMYDTRMSFVDFTKAGHTSNYQIPRLVKYD